MPTVKTPYEVLAVATLKNSINWQYHNNNNNNNNLICIAPYGRDFRGTEKRIPDIIDYKLKKDYQILIIVGTSITDNRMGEFSAWNFAFLYENFLTRRTFLTD